MTTSISPPSASVDFADLPLAPALLETLSQIDYVRMTPIQAASLPFSLAGRDVLAQAKTGSGKTAAFALPLLMRLNARHFAVQALVLCPTRELAEQVTQEIRRLARALGNIKILTVCGGTPMRPQKESLEHGAHVVVGTPGRIMDHLARGSLQLDGLHTLVLDEADRMLDMGFYDAMTFVADHCPAGRQSLLFSATFPDEILDLARRFLRQPQEVRLPEQHEGQKIQQRFYEVKPEQRLGAVAALLRHYRPASALAFCNTKQQCRDVQQELRAQGIEALALHGDLEQKERDLVLIRFANRSCAVLVATDVAARGLDIAQLAAVINVDVSPEPEVHVHRVGRTGRAGETGQAFTLCAPSEKHRVTNIARSTGITLDWHNLASLRSDPSNAWQAPMVTLQFFGGRKDKIRPGDILGTLTAGAGLTAEQVGKINITDLYSYAAVARDVAARTLKKLSTAKLKGKAVKVRTL